MRLDRRTWNDRCKSVEIQHTMLGSDVQRDREAWSLARNARNMNNALRVAGTCLAFGRSCDWIQPTGDCQLRRSDGMNQIDVQTSVVADSVGAVRIIFGLWGSRWVPEVGPVWFEDAGAGAYLLTLMLAWCCRNPKVVFWKPVRSILYLHHRTLSRRRRTCS